MGNDIEKTCELLREEMRALLNLMEARENRLMHMLNRLEAADPSPSTDILILDTHSVLTELVGKKLRAIQGLSLLNQLLNQYHGIINPEDLEIMVTKLLNLPV